MATQKRTTFERERDLSTIASLYLQGLMQREIVDRLKQLHYADRPDFKLTPQQIQYDIKAIQQRWLDSSMVDFNEAKSKELARIDEAEREYWDGWRRSKGQKQESRTEKKTGEKAYERAQLHRFDEAGDARFLDGVLRCVELRCKLLGLITNKVEGNLNINSWAELIKAASGEAPAADAA